MSVTTSLQIAGGVMFVILCLLLTCFVFPSSGLGHLDGGVGHLEAVGSVSERFLSVAIDSHVVAERWKNFDFHSEKVRNMASALSPAYLRLGGTAADLLTFDPQAHLHDDGNYFEDKKGDKHELKHNSEGNRFWCATSMNGSAENENLNNLYKHKKKFVMTGEDFDNLYNFSEAVGWTLLFDLNVLKRKGKSWNSNNAKKILEYAVKKEFTNIHWEMGNEPNSLKHHFNVSLPARQLGKDFWSLKQLLKIYPMFENSTLVGPDINGLRKCFLWTKRCKALTYLKNVLSTSGNVLDAITWHVYSVDGHTANLRYQVPITIFTE